MTKFKNNKNNAWCNSGMPLLKCLVVCCSEWPVKCNIRLVFFVSYWPENEGRHFPGTFSVFWRRLWGDTRGSCAGHAAWTWGWNKWQMSLSPQIGDLKSFKPDRLLHKCVKTHKKRHLLFFISHWEFFCLKL